MKKLFAIFATVFLAAFQTKNFQMFAVTQNLLSGKSRGRIGNLVMTSWKGLNVLKSKPMEVRNPNTVAQQTQRSKFSVLVAFARSILTSIRIGFSQYASNMSAYNAFMKSNMAISDIAPGNPAVLDYSKVVVSKGTLTGFLSPAIAGTSMRTISVSWVDNSGQGNAVATDILNYIVYNETKDIFHVVEGSVTRGSEGLVIDEDDFATGDTFHAWIYLTSADKSIVCDSFYGTGVFS
jgi:hypothetical protein